MAVCRLLDTVRDAVSSYFEERSKSKAWPDHFISYYLFIQDCRKEHCTYQATFLLRGRVVWMMLVSGKVRIRGIFTITTVLSGAEERFAEERPGWNFSKNKSDPGLEN